MSTCRAAGESVARPVLSTGARRPPAGDGEAKASAWTRGDSGAHRNQQAIADERFDVPDELGTAVVGPVDAGTCPGWCFAVEAP